MCSATSAYIPRLRSRATWSKTVLVFIPVTRASSVSDGEHATRRCDRRPRLRQLSDTPPRVPSPRYDRHVNERPFTRRREETDPALKQGLWDKLTSSSGPGQWYNSRPRAMPQ